MAGQHSRVESEAEQAAQAPAAPEPGAPPGRLPPVPSGGRTPQLTPGTVLGLQRTVGNAATTAGVELDRSGSQPLAAPTRTTMETAFGADFSGVTVHADSPRPGASRLAVTEGADVHFAPGAYQPGSQGGDHLIAHELAHVAQQRRGSGGAEVGRAAHEHDADRAAAAAASGERTEVALGAPAGTPQAYEANEHEGLGNVAGGDKIKITTTTGVSLTYGEIVALSGDFYRSPEAIMNAPADELYAILNVMRYEKDAVAKTGGIMQPGDAAEINKRYEAATSTSDRAKHHDHSSLGDEHDEHDGHEDHDADEEADDEDRVKEGGARRMTKYGPMVGDEHIEDAGQPKGGEVAGDKPSATGSFLDLADENSSHFSPENIRLNFKPKHLMAMDIALESYAKREGKPGRGYPEGPAPNAAATAQGEGAEPGAAPSARMHTLGPEGAAPTGPAPMQPVLPGGQAMPTQASGAAGGKPGEQEEARALMTSAFAAHFLTDAFAGGHLVSGVEARKHAPTWYAANKAAIATNVKRQWKADPDNEGQSDTRIGVTVDGILTAVESLDKIPGVLLKLVHDKFNSEGLEVKNPKGLTWSTKGDGSLANAPQTKGQAEASTKAARDVIQELVARGETAEPYAALDYVPDVIKTPGSGWRPIEEAAKDKAVYEAVWDERMLGTAAGTDAFYQLVKGYTGQAGALAGSIVKMKVLRGWESAKRGYRKAKKFLGEKWDLVKDWGSEQWDKAKDWGSEQWGKVKEAGSAAVDKAKEVGSSIGGWLGDTWDSAKSAAGNAVGAVKEWGAEKVDQVKQAGSDASKWIGETWDLAKKWGSDKVDAVVGGAKSLADKAASGGKALADKVTEMYRAGKRGTAEWLADQTDDLLGGPGEEGVAQSGTVPVTKVKQQTYAHGGFMGAGGAFMKDPIWSAIFQKLMKAEYERVSKIADPEKLMLALENNPVLAAYGSVRHLQEVAGAKSGAGPDAQHKALPLEWDVWLPPDPSRLTDLEAVKIAHGGAGTTLGQGVAGEDPVGFARDDIKNAPSGGEWMRIFGEAVALQRAGQGGKAQPPSTAKDGLAKLEGGASGSEAVAVAKEFLGPDGGLILDVKSTYSTAADIATFVAFLREQGLNVFGVGTFHPEQLSALDSGTRKVKFFHGINDFEGSAPELQAGDDVMFNGGSLLSQSREYVVAGKAKYAVDQSAYQRLVALQKAKSLNVGLYVQESAADPGAVEVITDLVNRNPEVFTRGFAYGNVSGDAEEKSEGTGLGLQWIFNR